MNRRRAAAVFFSVAAFCGLLGWSLLGGAIWFRDAPTLPVVGMFMWVVLQFSVEIADPAASPQRRLRRARSLLYPWMAVLGCSDLMATINSVGHPQVVDNIVFLRGGVVDALNCLYYAFFLDMVVLRPAEIWFGPAGLLPPSSPCCCSLALQSPPGAPAAR
jgi:hypothetical protein